MTQSSIQAPSLLAVFLAFNVVAQGKPDYPLGAGAAICVQSFEKPDLTIEARVPENGLVTYPLVGAVDRGTLGCGVLVCAPRVPGGYAISGIRTVRATIAQCSSTNCQSIQ